MAKSKAPAAEKAPEKAPEAPVKTLSLVESNGQTEIRLDGDFVARAEATTESLQALIIALGLETQVRVVDEKA